MSLSARQKVRKATALYSVCTSLGFPADTIVDVQHHTIRALADLPLWALEDVEKRIRDQFLTGPEAARARAMEEYERDHPLAGVAHG